MAHNYAEVGVGSFFPGAVDAYAGLIAESGLVPAGWVADWIAEQRRSLEDGTFFAPSPGITSSWPRVGTSSQGYTGLFSLTHHVFSGIGGYSSALLVIRSGVPIPLGFAAGGVVAGVAGYGIGALTLRMRALYLALATWAFAESTRVFVSMEYGITRGDLGLPDPKLFPSLSPRPAYELFLLLAALTVTGLAVLLRSRIGYRLRAIRDDEGAARATGIDTVRWKRFVFAASSATAGLAGAAYGHYIGLLSPIGMKFDEMALIIIMVILGGQRTLAGPVLGAVVVEIVSEALRAYGQIRMVLFALMVLGMMRLYPLGLVGMARTVVAGGPAAWRIFRTRVRPLCI